MLLWMCQSGLSLLKAVQIFRVIEILGVAKHQNGAVVGITLLRGLNATPHWIFDSVIAVNYFTFDLPSSGPCKSMLRDSTPWPIKYVGN